MISSAEYAVGAANAANLVTTLAELSVKSISCVAVPLPYLPEIRAMIELLQYLQIGAERETALNAMPLAVLNDNVATQPISARTILWSEESLDTPSFRKLREGDRSRRFRASKVGSSIASVL